MDSLKKLSEVFRQFPGIGPRQAGRFVYYLLTKDKKYLDELSKILGNLKNEVAKCANCQRFFLNRKRNGAVLLCGICSDNNRDQSLLMIVAKDADFETIEKGKTFNGLYFVLGGTVPILEKEPENRVRARELSERIKKSANNGLKEIIMALNANPEGENTSDFVTKLIKPIIEGKNIKISVLGRGLSTGAELEYVDPDTLKSALKNRS